MRSFFKVRCHIPILVVQDNDFNTHVQCPVMLGTNVIRFYKEFVANVDDLPVAWKLAVNSMKRSHSVQSLNEKPIVVCGAIPISSISRFVQRR